MGAGSNKEVGAIAEADSEVLLGMTDNVAVDQPDLWIADSAATVHMTPYKNGLVNLKKLKNNNHITMGNGEEEQYKVIGDLIGEVQFNGQEEWSREVVEARREETWGREEGANGRATAGTKGSAKGAAEEEKAKADEEAKEGSSGKGKS